jgi:hypothetical protein
MKKEEFLALAEQLFDQSNPVVEETKIPLDQNIYAEIVDQISSEISDAGTGIISDYELEIYSREIELSSVEFNFRDIENAVRSVLNNYFVKIN